MRLCLNDSSLEGARALGWLRRDLFAHFRDLPLDGSVVELLPPVTAVPLGVADS